MNIDWQDRGTVTGTDAQNLKAISFDLDDTLWSIEPVILRAEQAMYAYLAERYPRVTEAYDVDAMRAVRVHIATQHPAMRHDFTFLRMAALEFHAEAAGYPASMAAEAFEVFYRIRNEVDLYADVEPALERLTKRFALFTVSNGNADLAAVGLAQYFAASIAARDAGALKPDLRIYRRLVDTAGVEPREILHVGDDPVADVDGARSAGMRAAWLNRSGSMWPSDREPPSLTLRSLADLVAALG